MKNGFSLVELLISLIVISCITAAFSPLITKKFNNAIYGGGGAVSDITNECEKFGENCTLCTSNFCIVCQGLTCAEDEYKDTRSCTCKKCTETYGEKCTKCNEDKCLICPQGQFLNENEQCEDCSAQFNNCAQCTAIKCTSCTKGFVMTDPGSSNPCAAFTCSSPNFIQIDDLCVTAKNMGDNSILTIPDTINKVNTGSECDSTNDKCCWSGNSANQSACNEDNGNYSGCSRTACNWSAADEICKKYNYAGLSWRLATDDEMQEWNLNSIDIGANGLQLCDSFSGYLSAQCAQSTSCNGAFDNICNNYSLWTNNHGSTNSNVYSLNQGVWNIVNLSTQSALSVRCVAKFDTDCKDKFSTHCKSCSSSSCITCDNSCKDDEYLDAGDKCTCKKCTEKYGDLCTNCNAKQCLSCATDYELSDNPSSPNACEPIFTCSGPDFMQIGNLCITRKNMGDSVNLTIPSGVNMRQINQSCSPSSTNFCCWQGNTSGPYCDNSNGGNYSGCNRTVCDWWAANYICKNFHAGNYIWRLPTRSEMSNWGVNSVKKGTNGLQLCDQSVGYSSAGCGDYNICPGAYNNQCSPDDVWSSEKYNSTSAYDYDLVRGGWIQSSWNFRYPFSVRCVTDFKK